MSLTSLELLRFLLEFALLLAVARLLGDIARRLKQPQVIGELLTGVVIGPSILGAFFPVMYHTLFPTHGVQGLLLQLISQLGVIFLLLLSGLETQINIVRQYTRLSIVISACGVIVSFAAGYVLATLLPRSLMANPTQHTAFLLFVATAISMSAIPVIVKILIDMNLIARQFGQLILAIGIVTDTTGWFLLSFITGIATSQHLPIKSLLFSMFGTLAFAVFCFTIGYLMIRYSLEWIKKQFDGESPVLSSIILSSVIVIGLAGAAVTQWLGVEAFLGAFLVGIQMARVSHITNEALPQLRGLTIAVFAPVFFASAGLKVNLTQMNSVDMLLIMLAVIGVATVSKFFGTYIGARVAGLTHWAAIGLGSALNARGAVEIIVATIGLQMGILTTQMYTIIVIMAVATSMMAPPLLRWSLRHQTEMG